MVLPWISAHFAPDDLFQSKEVNYHYLLVEVDRGKLQVTMKRLELRR
ncbi:MAG TPA: hypothetical protein VEI01_04530 [Terriglobales bacterium]|nr:hypothetical protein [Terriglobales bacterium]